ncbi:hypothetical protein BH10PLA2_BH10PLA2_21290 [soil metagenome]
MPNILRLNFGMSSLGHPELPVLIIQTLRG